VAFSLSLLLLEQVGGTLCARFISFVLCYLGGNGG
jgi:hypothetical protein